MATYTYSNWTTQETPELQLSALNLHIAEVAEKLNSNTTVDGMAEDNTALVQYHQNLLKERITLQKQTGTTLSSTSVRVLGTWTRARAT